MLAVARAVSSHVQRLVWKDLLPRTYLLPFSATSTTTSSLHRLRTCLFGAKDGSSTLVQQDGWMQSSVVTVVEEGMALVLTCPAADHRPITLGQILFFVMVVGR